MKIPLKVFLVFSLFFSMLPLSAEARGMFKDVPESTQFYPAINWAHSSGLIKGYTYDTFKPKNYLTEAHFALMMARFIEPDAFSKNPNRTERDIAYNVVLKKHNIILKGHSSIKQRELLFTRLDVAKAFYAYVEKKSPASDKQAIDWMYHYNISSGKNVSSDKYIDFGGNDKLKREHMVQFFKNLYTNWYFDKHVLKQSFKETELFQKDAPFHSPTLVDFNGDGIKEMVLTYETYNNEYSIRMEGYRYYAMYHYNDATNLWELINGGFLYTPGKDGGLTYEVKSLTGNKQEQLLIYYYAYRSLSIAAITAENLQDMKLSIPDLYAHPSPEREYRDNGIVLGPLGHYTGFYRIENGRLTRKSLTQIPPVTMPNNAVEINYSINEDDYVISSYNYGDTIDINVGEQIIFTQGKNNWLEKPVRIMSSVLEGSEDTNTFAAPGLIEYQILPNHDWENEFTIYVRIHG